LIVSDPFFFTALATVWSTRFLSSYLPRLNANA